MPEELGKVQERFTGKGERMIIQIQDAHANITAQQNIAAILERLATVFGVRTAALEGAWVTTSLSQSHAIPTSREKQLLATSLLDEDRISGPVYAAIMSPNPITLVGIEDEAFYEKNRSLFLAHLEKEAKIREKLSVYGAELEASQKAGWNPDLLAFGIAFMKFRATSDLGKFFPLLMKTAKDLGCILDDQDQLLLLQGIMELERSVVKERLEEEVKSIMREYKNTPWTLEELVRGGRIPKEKMGTYPEVKKLHALFQMRDKISLADLSAQITTLTGRVLTVLLETQEESDLWEKTVRFLTASKILALEATPEDLELYENEKAPLEKELAGAGLEDALALSAEFYAMVKKRDEVFFDRLVHDPALTGNAAVVTGGFHTEGLSRKLREAGISYVTITPDLGGAAMNEKLYTERMQETQTQDPVLTAERPGLKRVEGQTLSELRNTLAWIDERFTKSYSVLLQTKDVRKAVKVFLGMPVTVSQAEKVRDLAARKKLRKNRGAETVSVLDLKVSEFEALSHEEQLEIVRALIDRAEHPERRPAMVSSVSALVKLAEDPNASGLVERALKSGDTIALLKDATLSENLLFAANSDRVRFFEVPEGGMDAMVSATPQFSVFVRHHPAVIVKDGYVNAKYPVLEERAESFVLYRIITLSEPLYRAAKDPKFRELLARLVTEILSQELPKKSV